MASIYASFNKQRPATYRINELKERMVHLQDLLSSLEGLTARRSALATQRAAPARGEVSGRREMIYCEDVVNTHNWEDGEGVNYITKHEGTDLPVY